MGKSALVPVIMASLALLTVCNTEVALWKPAFSRLALGPTRKSWADRVAVCWLPVLGDTVFPFSDHLSIFHSNPRHQSRRDYGLKLTDYQHTVGFHLHCISSSREGHKSGKQRVQCSSLPHREAQQQPPGPGRARGACGAVTGRTVRVHGSAQLREATASVPHNLHALY